MHHYLHRTLPLFLLLTLFLPSLASGKEPTVLSDPPTRISLIDHFYFLDVDESPNADFLTHFDLSDHVLLPAQYSPRLSPNEHLGAPPYLLIGDLTNHSSLKAWVFSSLISDVENLEVWLIDRTDPDHPDAVQKLSLGTSNNAWKRHYPVVGHHAPLQLKFGHAYRLAIFFPALSSPPINLSELTILPSEDFIAQAFRLNAVLILALGILLAIGLYMLSLAISLRDLTQLFFSLFCFFSALMWATHYEVTRLFIAPTHDLLLLNYFATSAQNIFIILFTRRFLHLNTITPLLSRLLLVLASLGVILLGLIPFLTAQLSYLFNAGLSGLTLLLMPVAAIYALIKGIPSARLYLISFLLLFLAASFAVLDALLLNLPTMTIRLITLAATSLSVLFITSSVVHQIRRLQLDIYDAQKLANSDALTSLRNRLALEDDLQVFKTRYQQGDFHDLTVVFSDLDGFKSINDTHGHDHGDRLLKAFASELLQHFRDHDHIYRYGGDEFVLFLPHPTAEKPRHAWIQHRFQIIKERLQNQGFPHFDISLGSAAFSEVPDHPAQALSLADQRMYRQKRTKKQAASSSLQPQAPQPAPAPAPAPTEP